MRAASSSLTASPCRIGALGQCATGPAGECPDHPVPDAAKAHVATGGHRSDRWQLAHGDDGRAGLISGGQAGPKRMLRRWPASGRFHLESGEAQVMCGCGRAGERRPDSSSGRRGPGQPARSGDRGPRRTWPGAGRRHAGRRLSARAGPPRPGPRRWRGLPVPGQRRGGRARRGSPGPAGRPARPGSGQVPFAGELAVGLHAALIRAPYRLERQQDHEASRTGRTRLQPTAMGPSGRAPAIMVRLKRR